MSKHGLLIFFIVLTCTYYNYGLCKKTDVPPPGNLEPKGTCLICFRDNPPLDALVVRSKTSEYESERTTFDLLRFWDPKSKDQRRHDFGSRRDNEIKGNNEKDQSTTKPDARRIQLPVKLTAKNSEPNKRTSHIADEKAVLTPYNLLRYIKETYIEKYKDDEVDVTYEVLGRTLEYNDIILIKAVSTRTANGQNFRAKEDKFDDSAPEKKIIFIVHGLSTMGIDKLPCLSTVGGLDTLLSFYYSHLDRFDILVIPMANPDGTSAQRNTALYWNKNLSPQSACPGVALDRNFDVAWNNTHAGALSSCSQHFPGVEPFSEFETQAIRDIFHKYSEKIVAYINVHAATFHHNIFKGDALLHPKGFSESANDDDKYVDLKGEIEEMMKNTTFQVYSFAVDSLYNWYGKTSGTSVDYASSVYGIPFAMEFAMQLYFDGIKMNSQEEDINKVVLKEVWARIIDVVFDFIYKHTKPEKNGD